MTSERDRQASETDKRARQTSERDRQASETDKRARQTSERDRQASETDKRARHFFALYIIFSQLIHHNAKNQLKSITAIYISHFFIISTNIHVVTGFVTVVIMLHCRPISLSI